MSKFDSPGAEYLYSVDPDDTAGSSSEGPYWVALFVGDLVGEATGEARRELTGYRGAVLYENSDGSVRLDLYEDASKAREAFRTERLYLEIGNEYDDEDGEEERWPDAYTSTGSDDWEPEDAY